MAPRKAAKGKGKVVDPVRKLRSGKVMKPAAKAAAPAVAAWRLGMPKEETDRLVCTSAHDIEYVYTNVLCRIKPA